MNLNKIKENISLLDYSKFDNKKTAVMITAFNRPQYYKQVIRSINQCDELENIPIFIFLDGGILAKTKENIEISKNIIHKNKFVLPRNKNYGSSRGILSSLNLIFKELEFEFCFVLEDDLVVGKNYFNYVYENYKKIKQKDKNIGTFQGWNKCLLSFEEKEEQKNLIVDSIDEHFWGYIMEKNVYEDIEHILKKYESLLKEMPYDHTWKNYRDQFLSPKIRNFYKNLLIEKNNELLEKQFTENFLSYATKKFSGDTVGLDQDSIIELALFLEGKKRYFPIVNRSLCIGEVGLHQYPGLWQQMDLDKVKLEEF